MNRAKEELINPSNGVVIVIVQFRMRQEMMIYRSFIDKPVTYYKDTVIELSEYKRTL